MVFVPLGIGSAPRIGLSLGTLQEERWQRDRDRFVARAEELGAEVLVQSGNSETARQMQDIESLLSRGDPGAGRRRPRPDRDGPGRRRRSCRRGARRLLRPADHRLRRRPVSQLRQRARRPAPGGIPRPPAWRKGSACSRLRAEDRPDRSAVQAGSGRGARPAHRSRRHRRGPRGLRSGLEARRGEADRQRRDHGPRAAIRRRARHQRRHGRRGRSRPSSRRVLRARCW